MILTEAQRNHLLAELEKAGWHRRDDFIYAPHETIWLLLSEPWSGDLQDFHDRMIGRLQRIENLREHRPLTEHQKGVDDTSGLIKVLQTMISKGV